MRPGKGREGSGAPVTIYSIELLREEHPDYTIRVSCSKGTYIRTLCHDVGELLGCGGVMTGLKRTRVGEFWIEQAYTLEELQKLSESGELGKVLLPVEYMFRALPGFKAGREDYRALRNGNQLNFRTAGVLREGKGANLPFSKGQEFRMYSHENIFYGIYRYDEVRGLLVPVKMFLPEEG